MEINNRTVDKNGETAAKFQGSDKSAGLGNVKNIIADNLHNAAEFLQEKASDQEDAQPAIAQYGKQASRWLDQSAGYVRQFDYEQADESVREYVGQNPWRSLLIAGGFGLIVGAVLRRR